ncbi:uncharacterized protein LOC134694478 [Mytilus trossulus]|uniref:uncharacterized protein LOC134694478 n=1 Tax=Mytilus trossulus TaxID=6551 RepID=UPI0030040D09
MAVSYLKGLCTRYNNLLAKELDKSGYMIAQGIQDERVSTQSRQVVSAERRLKDFAAKLEESMKEDLLILEETLLAESEAVVNSRPLVYIEDDINSNIILTPAHCLTLNPKTGFPDHNEEDSTDPEYLPQFSSAKKLLLTWQKGQKHLTMFLKTWIDKYLLSLCERTAYKLRSGRIQCKTPAMIGDIVLIKENLP